MTTCIDGYPIGLIIWDPRNRPEHVEIGHKESVKGMRSMDMVICS